MKSIGTQISKGITISLGTPEITHPPPHGELHFLCLFLLWNDNHALDYFRKGALFPAFIISLRGFAPNKVTTHTSILHAISNTLILHSPSFPSRHLTSKVWSFSLLFLLYVFSLYCVCVFFSYTFEILSNIQLINKLQKHQKKFILKIGSEILALKGLYFN